MDEKFSWHKFFIHITSRKFWVWVVATYFTFRVVSDNGDHAYIMAVIVAWGIISVIYLIGDPIERALSVAVSKMEMKMQIGTPSIGGGGRRD